MTLPINIRSLLDGAIQQSNHVTRYSGKTVLKVETVAQHTCNTVMYCSVIGYLLISKLHKVDMALLLNRAIWHDIEETKTGDLLRGVKHGSPVIRSEIEKIGQVAVEEIAYDLSFPSLIKFWSLAKDNSIEGEILRVADYISVISYLVGEHKMGNRSLSKIHCEVMSYFEDVLKHVKNDDLQDLLLEVGHYFKSEVWVDV